MPVMDAVRFYGPKDLRIEKVDIPGVGPDEVLVKVAYAGICGSDLHIYKKGMFITDLPQTLGHEFSGVVEKVGSQVKDFAPGDRVVADPRVFCGHCALCLAGRNGLCNQLGFIGEVQPGSFATYLQLKAAKLLSVPGEIDLQEAALAEPLAVGLQIAKISGFATGKTIGVIGAGTIGVLTALIAQKIYRAEEIFLIDLSADRLKLALKNGVTKTGEDYSLCGQVDIVVEAAGSGAAFVDALDWVRPAGKIVLAGIYEDDFQFNPNLIVSKEINLTGIHGCHYQDIADALYLLQSNQLDLSRMHSVISMKEAGEAFEQLTNEKKVLKVLLSPDR